MSGAAIVFFAFIGFDAVSTTAEETKNPQRDLPIGMIASLIICTMLYVLMSGVLTGIKKYTVYLGDSAAVATAFAAKPGRRRSSAPVRSPGSPLFCSSFSSAAAHFHGDGAGRIAAAIFRPHSSAFPHAAHDHHLDRCWRRWRRDADRYRFAWPT